MKILLRAYFHPKKFFRKKLAEKLLGSGSGSGTGSGRFRKSDPDVFECQIRIWSKIVRIRNTASTLSLYKGKSA
jgi:hypothetical protein